MRSGYIPDSLNVPFPDLLDSTTKEMKSPDELEAQMLVSGVPLNSLLGPNQGQVVTSCGSGVTACIVGLGLHQLGVPLDQWSVYDGSWTEWGGRRSPD